MSQKRKLNSAIVMGIICLVAIVGLATFLTIFAVWTRGLPSDESDGAHLFMFFAAPVIYISLALEALWIYFTGGRRNRP